MSAASGAFWTIVFSALGKAVTFAGQFAMAWILVPEDLGLVALTLSVMNFTAVVGGGNLKNILVQGGNNFDENVRHAFWLSLTLNILAGLLLAGCSPVMALIFQEPRVVPLLLIAAFAVPIQSLSTVYVAALHRELRFKKIAFIQFGAAMIQNGGAVALALLGYGANSLIVPLIFNAVFMAIAFRCSVGRLPIGRPEPPSLWRLSRPAGWLIANALFVAILNSGANLAIGLWQFDADVAGYYYWGASLSCQAVFLLVTNLQGVLFPILGRLNDDSARQVAAAARACRTLLAVVAPFCIIQALLVGPFIKMAFHDRWLPAVPVAQLLSLALITQPFHVLAVALLMARGEFRLLVVTNALLAIAVLLAAICGARLGSHVTVAAAVGFALLIANLCAGLYVLRHFGLGWSRLCFVAVRPAICAVITGIAGWGVSILTVQATPISQFGITGGVTLAVAALSVRIAMRTEVAELLKRLFGERVTGLLVEVRLS